MNSNHSFSPRHHIPKYSILLLRALKTPILIYITLVGNAFTLIGAILFWHLEAGTNPALATFFDAIWWALATISTVGYGDIVPVTIAGKVIGIALITIGVSLFLTFMAVLVSVVNTLLAEEEQNEFSQIKKRLRSLEEKIDLLSQKSD